MSSDALAAVHDALTRDGIIPDILTESFVPTTLLHVKFPSGDAVALGNTLPAATTQDEPAVSFAVAHAPADATYTVICLDLDATSRATPIYRSYRHWVVRLFVA